MDGLGMYDVIIIGAGPAGLTAALYCAQANLRVLALERLTMGGKILDVERIENYPGFADGVNGAELGGSMLAQAIKYGMEIQLATADALEIDGNTKLVKTNSGAFLGKTVILAGGARPKKLGVPGEDAFYGRGLGYCAYCEGGQFAGKIAAVCGGGDAGITDALYLARIASRVMVIEVMPELEALPLLLKRVEEADERIEILCNTRVEAIIGDTEIRGIEVSNTVTQEIESLPVEGALVRIGWEPETEFLREVVPLDSEGYVLVNDVMETDLPGVFAAGDIRHGSPMQVSTAVGDGTVAAICALRYLRMAEFGSD